jgi:Mce-associated membrane protein
MADDAAGKDAKKADESAVTSDTAKTKAAEGDESSAPPSPSSQAESTPGAVTDAVADEVADFDAETAAKDSEDSEDTDDEDISLEPDEEEKTPKRMQGRHWAWTAAAVVVIAIASGTAIIGRLYEEQRSEERSSREALAAAQEFAGVLTNVDSAKLDDNYNKTMDGSTGKFKDMYGKSSAQLRQILVENKASSRGVVVDSAVKTATPNKVEVLLFIDQSVSNVAVPEPRMDRSRVQMTMEKVDGRWLASDVELT